MTPNIAGRTGPLYLPLFIMLILIFSAGPAFSAEFEISDENVRKAVEDEIHYDRLVSLNDVDVDVTSGIAVLSGQTSNLLAKRRAARVARTVKGVLGVDNRIEVSPPVEISDTTLRDRIKNALLADPASEAYEVSVAVRDNKAILGGTVASWQEKILAEKVTAAVRGVARVENNITVEYLPERPEKQILADVRQTLAYDVLVEHGLIKVRVDGSKVTLSGSVGSAAERSEAVADAWVAGVSEVDASNLEVDPGAGDPKLRMAKHEQKEDEAIAGAIRRAITLNPRVREFDVAVEVNNGKARLYGVVDNARAKRVAGRLARRTVGVSSVKNRVRVRPDGGEIDTEIQSRVLAALKNDPYLEGYEVDAAVMSNVAYLYGVVDSYFEKARAEEAAATVRGVKAVKNNTAVRDVTLSYDPYVDGDYVYDVGPFGPTDLEAKFLSDAEIQERIEEEIWWSPHVDSDDVQVAVDAGVASLTGAVDSWKERVLARQEAYEGGAADVIDRMKNPDE